MEHFVTKFAENGYLAVFALMLLESACIPIPSEITMLFAGALASPTPIVEGAPHLSLAGVILVGTAANLAGSWIAYGAGRLIGREPFDRYGKYVGIRSHDIDKAEIWWAKHGQGTVFFSRMLPVVRTFISLPAGIAEMSFWRFTVYTVAGCLPWVAALGGTGYALGRNWDTILGQFRVASYVIAALILVVAAVLFVRHRRKAPGEV